VALDHLRHLLDSLAEAPFGVRAPRRDHDEGAQREAERGRVDLRRVCANRPFLLEPAQSPPHGRRAQRDPPSELTDAQPSVALEGGEDPMIGQIGDRFCCE